MPKWDADKTEATIQLAGEEDATVVYSNFAKVTITPLDAIITFAFLDPATMRSGDNDGGPSVDARPVARVVLPHQMLAGFINALHTEIKKHPEIGVAIAGE